MSTVHVAADYLAKNDPVLRPIIMRTPLPSFTPHTNYYQELIDSIIGQQLSVAAARTIRARFMALFDNQLPSPERILATDPEELRAVGLSRPKVAYIQDLAGHIIDGTLTFEHIDEMPNEAIISMLTAVKGIGEWTAHMFLMFCMGRLDILPTGDLGIRNGIKLLYGFDHPPTPADVKRIANEYHWEPYQSVASWYVWKSLEAVPIGSESI